MKKPTNRDGFNLVAAKFDSYADMARALEVTRAAVAIWQTAGIPLKHVPKLKRLTGLRGRDILPEVAALMD